ncbi:hypothetical protein Scep_015648 [Stephania cephalantha]|uniref:Auxin response factor n=1 Tax=Stephania cephalantha TaxID=152367 RepID=A0AAP0P0L0_9MAGN
MEIDLNYTLEEESECFNGGEEKGKGVVDVSVGSGVSSLSSSSSSTASSSIYHELWHACAGPLTSLPKNGSLIVYFPQGHLEQLISSSSSHYHALNLPKFNLPSQIFCRVVDVQLLANKENDEVYAKVDLLPQTALEEGNLERYEHEEGVDVSNCKGRGSGRNFTPHMFCKTLTASDTSSHGGFSVPRRAAENCFPPLDHNQQRPSQEIAAKDLHGVEWKFRHIYRGQPRRHLLTTGWSGFISKKNLVSGDAVLFLRGEDGELRLGIRRANRPRNFHPDSVLGTQDTPLDTLSHLAKAASTKSVFHVLYNPRDTPSEFVVPYEKYKKSIINPVAKGTRFKMSFKMEDTAERRYSGIVSGIGDLDPYRWPNSKWRCLMVRWDENIVNDYEGRVSPWDIEPSSSVAHLSGPLAPKLKKPRIDLPPTSFKNPVNLEDGSLLEFDQYMRSFKVLQGQESLGFISPHFESCEVQPASHTGFSESARFMKVLQGQEIFPLASSLHGRAEFHLNGASNNNLTYNMLDMHGRLIPPLGSNVNAILGAPLHEHFKLNGGLAFLPYLPNLQGSIVQSNVHLGQRKFSAAMGDGISDIRSPNFTTCKSFHISYQVHQLWTKIAKKMKMNFKMR